MSRSDESLIREAASATSSFSGLLTTKICSCGKPVCGFNAEACHGCITYGALLARRKSAKCDACGATMENIRRVGSAR